MSNIPGVEIYSGNSSNRHFFNFSSKYGMLMNWANRDIVKAIEKEWANDAQSPLVVERTTPFSPELQRRMAESLKMHNSAPVRRLTGRFDTLDVHETDHGNQTELTLLSMTDDGTEHKLVVQANTDTDAGGLLAISACQLMSVGTIYRLSVYNVLDRQSGYRKTIVTVEDQAGKRLISENDNGYFAGWTNSAKIGREQGISQCQIMRVNIESQKGKEIISQMVRTARGQYIEGLIHQSGLSGASVPPVDSTGMPEYMPNRQQQAPNQNLGYQQPMNQGYVNNGYDDNGFDPMPARQQQVRQQQPMNQGYGRQQQAPQQRQQQGGYNQPRQGFTQQQPHQGFVSDDSIPF